MTTEHDRNAVLLDIKSEVASLKPVLNGLLVELNRQQRSTHDARDFVINEFRALVSAIDRLTAQLSRLS